MHRRGFLTAAVVAGVVWCGAATAIEPVNPNLNHAAREVLDYLASVYGKKMLAGYNVYVHTPDDYQQTGMHAAIWSRDVQWLGDAKEMAADAKKYRYILSLHWHWFFDNDSAWTAKRKTPVDVGKMVTAGTVEHEKTMAEFAETADKLQVFEDAGVPVLWRPLHEIDGGWFFWTDKEHPENTAKLWRMMYDYFTNTRKLDNLIWVYSAGVGNKSVEYRKRFYPGAAYVDISGIDIYGVDYRKDVDKYREYYDVMSKVSPGKMLACAECDAIADPVKTAAGELPKWLYALPWWGAPSNNRPVDWARFTMRHEMIVTLDELPAFGQGNIAPDVGILEPRDDGSAWFVSKPPKLEAYAVDRDGSVREVEFFADGKSIGRCSSAPYTFTWKDAAPGCYDVTVRAVDNSGQTTGSNSVRIAVGMEDLARGKAVVASSGKDAEAAVDGDYYTNWAADKGDDAWIYVDLGAVERIERVNLFWGWKIHAADYSIDVATSKPGQAGNWKSVYTEKNHPYKTWEAACRVRFEPVQARYVRMHATRRAGNQNWAGYNLTAFEVPRAVR